MNIYLVSSSAFSIGLRFYYWRMYQNMDVLQLHAGGYQNNIDHGGYKPSELYVDKKYETFKEEILNYHGGHFNISHYNTEVLPKATAYLSTDYGKQIKANTGMAPPHYEIPNDSLISISHLISIIMYCDYTKLSASFSSTFRKQHTFETLAQIKNRNSTYFWFSKLLRETVELFGEYSYFGKLVGPFYCGLSMVLNMSSFFIRLYSPTSTSKSLQVAMKFSGDDGVIMKLDNPKGSEQCTYLRGFNCDWISRFKEEQERYSS